MKCLILQTTFSMIILLLDMGEYLDKFLGFFLHRYLLLTILLLIGWLIYKIIKDLTHRNIEDIEERILNIRPMLVNAIVECYGAGFSLKLINSGQSLTVVEIKIPKNDFTLQENSRSATNGESLFMKFSQVNGNGKFFTCLGSDIKIEVFYKDRAGNHYKQKIFNTGSDQFNVSLPELLSKPGKIIFSADSVA